MLATLVTLMRFARSVLEVWLQRPLVDRGFGLIYDTARNITWLQDANYAKTTGRTRDGQMTWYEATAWVRALSYRGIHGWRLPTARNADGSGPCVGHDCDDSEIGHLFLVAVPATPGHIRFDHFQNNAKYWNSTEASETDAYGWDFFAMRQGTLAKDPFSDPLGISTLTGPVLTWPVHDGDVAPEIVRRMIRVALSPAGWFSRG